MESTHSAGLTPDPLSEWVEEVRPTRPPRSPRPSRRSSTPCPGRGRRGAQGLHRHGVHAREDGHDLTRAAEAYDRKRYEEALRLGRTVADATPGVASVRELTGSRPTGRSAGHGQDPPERPLHDHRRSGAPSAGDGLRPGQSPLRAVEKNFALLEESEPTAEVLIEGRIVMASAWADQQKYAEAIELLTRAGGTKQLRNPSFRHVRLWYALADIFDRAGDVTSARELFARVVIAEPEAYDAAARLAELGAGAPRKNRKRRTTSVSKKKVD